MKRALSIAAILIVSGCVSAGTKVDDKQVAAFERGKTTYTDVIKALGTPTTETVNGDGSRMFVYTFTQSQARPESFIPFIGPLVGGADARSQAVILRFTPDGHLVESSRTNTQVGVGTGIISGSMPQAKPATP